VFTALIIKSSIFGLLLNASSDIPNISPCVTSLAPTCNVLISVQRLKLDNMQNTTLFSPYFQS